MANFSKMSIGKLMGVIMGAFQKVNEIKPKLEKAQRDLLADAEKMVESYKADLKSVKREKAYELVQRFVTLLPECVVTPQPEVVVENKAKSVTVNKEVHKAAAEKAKAKKKQQQEESQAAEPTPTKEEKKSIVVVKKATAKSRDMVEFFPDSLESEGVGKFRFVGEEIKDFPSFKAAREAGRKLAIAFYWNERQLKQFKYDPNGVIQNPSKFNLDLDVASVLYAGEKIAHTISLYTEKVYSLAPEDFNIERGVRFSAGLEFALYELIEEV